MSFALRRGTNVSHWLSQSDRRGDERRAWFTRDDVQRLAELGLDHLRFPLGEEQLWDEQGAADGAAFALLDEALGWCEEAGLRAVADLHILRSHDPYETDRLFTDGAAQERFLACWDSLAGELRRWSASLLAYELLNEPVAPEPDGWNVLARHAFELIRTAEPERTIILGASPWYRPDALLDLEIPDDERIVLTFHSYEPRLLTHYRAEWTPLGAYDGPIAYPGELVPDEAYAALGDEARAFAGPLSYDADAMEAALAPALAVSAATGLPLYCGELGVFATVPDELRERWYDDFLGVLERHEVGWATWDYKGGFALVDGDGGLTAAGRAVARASA
jgi:endoglucanase